jgi:tricorn protease-like protein
MEEKFFPNDRDVIISHDYMPSEEEAKDLCIIMDEGDETIKNYIVGITGDRQLAGFSTWGNAHKVVILTATTTPLLETIAG